MARKKKPSKPPEIKCWERLEEEPWKAFLLFEEYKRIPRAIRSIPYFLEQKGVKGQNGGISSWIKRWAKTYYWEDRALAWEDHINPVQGETITAINYTDLLVRGPEIMGKAIDIALNGGANAAQVSMIKDLLDRLDIKSSSIKKFDNPNENADVLEAIKELLGS